MARQSTHRLLMVRPARFGFNPETAPSNSFQSDVFGDVAGLAVAEFDEAVEVLRGFGCEVQVVEDTPEPAKPDAIFPNNWLMLHESGRAFFFPMESPSRRLERRSDILPAGVSLVDLSRSETEGLYLEGTGSIVVDWLQPRIFACESSRTSFRHLEAFSGLISCDIVFFQALNSQGKPIYHTNVMMAIGTQRAVVCFDSVPEESVRVEIREKLGKRTIIPISMAQMESFAGNMLEVRNAQGEVGIVLSETAWRSLDPNQQATLGEFGEVLRVKIPTIETVGGGGIRCMICENFCPELPS